MSNGLPPSWFTFRNNTLVPYGVWQINDAPSPDEPPVEAAQDPGVHARLADLEAAEVKHEWKTAQKYVACYECGRKYLTISNKDVHVCAKCTERDATVDAMRNR